jgi:hypothetical protein
MSSAKSQIKKSVLTTTMGLLSLITASSAYGGPKVLSVPLVPQVNSNWCWAAAGQMIFNYLGATRVTQSGEVNQALHRSDCCPSTVTCSSNADCTPAGAVSCSNPPPGGNAEDFCIPASATLCNKGSDCKNTEACAPTTVA